MMYAHDRDIPNKIWNEYLTKYKKYYHIKKFEDNIYGIISEFGFVKPYSILRHELVFYGSFLSSRKKNAILALKPPSVRVTQNATAEACIVFSENKLIEVSKWLKLKKKINFTPKQMEKIRKQFDNEI